MSIFSSSIFIFLVYTWMCPCSARPSAMQLKQDLAENKVVDKVKGSVNSNMDQGTNVGDIGVAKASMETLKKQEDYSSSKIEGHDKKMKVKSRKDARDLQNDEASVGFDSADYSQPRTHPPSHN